MIDIAACIVLAGFAGFLFALGVLALAAPQHASAFLLGFATTPVRHYMELVLRLLVGAALVLVAPRTLLPGAFVAFGWLLLGTTGVLLCLPWRWHRRFAERAVPQALRFLPMMGLVSIALGGFLLFAGFADAGQ